MTFMNRSPDLLGLEAPPGMGHTQVSKQPGGEPALSVLLLVDVHDLTGPDLPDPVAEEIGGHLPSRLRVDAENRGVDLDPGRDPDGHETFPHGGEDVPGRAVAACEHQQVCAGLLHGPGRLDGILGRGRLAFPGGSDQRKRQTG
jgi:hypothetical protein